MNAHVHNISLLVNLPTFREIILYKEKYNEAFFP